MIIQAVKKQRCMKIEPDTGIVHYIQEISAEDEERKALACLGLWKQAGYDSMPSFLATTVDDKELLSPDPENNMSIEALRLKAIGNSQKGFMECSLLLVLTDLINNQEYLTLQTCSRPAILPRGIALPPGQVVEIRRKDFNAATQILSAGLGVSRKVTEERRLFAKGILEIRKNWRVLSHSSILATKKHLQQRALQIDGRRKDIMYIDCSYVSSGDKLSSLEEFLVPLRIGPKGPVLDPKELEVTCKTLKLSLVNRLNGEIVTSTTAWSSGVDTSGMRCSESSSRTNLKEHSSGCHLEDDLDSNLISRIHSHCRRRQHDALSKRLFARLRKAAIEDHDRFIVQSNTQEVQQRTRQKPPMDNLSNSKNIKNQSDNDFALFEGKIIGSLEVSMVGKGRIELNISNELLLVITLEVLTPSSSSSSSSSSSRIPLLSPFTTATTTSTTTVPTPSSDIPLHIVVPTSNDDCTSSPSQNEGEKVVGQKESNMEIEEEVEESRNGSQDCLNGDEGKGKGGDGGGVSCLDDPSLYVNMIVDDNEQLSDVHSSSDSGTKKYDGNGNGSIHYDKDVSNSGNCSKDSSNSKAIGNNNDYDLSKNEAREEEKEEEKDITSCRWLSHLFSGSILNSQLLLLTHWKKSLDQIQESARQEERLSIAAAAATAISSSSNSSSSRSNNSDPTDVIIKTENPIDTASPIVKSEIVIKSEMNVPKNVVIDNAKNVPAPGEPSLSSKDTSLEESSSKEHSFESHSTSLTGVNFCRRLVDPSLRGRARDVGDGIAFALSLSSAGDALSTNRNLRNIKNENISSSSLLTGNINIIGNNNNNNNNRISSSAGHILLGLIDVIRSGLQKQRVFRALKIIKNDIYNRFKINIHYNLVPSYVKKDEKDFIKKEGKEIQTDISNTDRSEERKKLKREFLFSDQIDFYFLLPDCSIFISATPRYGFEVKSVVSTAANISTSSDSFSTFLSSEEYRNIKMLYQSSSSSSSSSSSTIYTQRSSSNRYSGCDSLFHPVCVRLDSPCHLSELLSSIAIGSYLSVALCGLSEGSSLAATQITPTLFSISRQYLHDENVARTCIESASCSDGPSTDLADVGALQCYQKSENDSLMRTLVADLDGPSEIQSGVRIDDMFFATMEIDLRSGECREVREMKTKIKISIIINFAHVNDRTLILKNFEKTVLANGEKMEMESETGTDGDSSKRIQFTIDTEKTKNLLSLFVDSLLIAYSRPASVFSCPCSS